MLEQEIVHCFATEVFIEYICDFLNINENGFRKHLQELRDKKWERWGGGTVEISVAEILYVIARTIKPNTIFEAGTNWGYSTANLIEACNDNKNGFVYSVDIESTDIAKAKQFISLKTNSTNYSLEWSDSVFFLRNFLTKNKKIDMAFIDSSHEYQHTKNEWAKLVNLIHDNSIILFHDAFTDSYGIKKFLNELDSNWEAIILPTQTNTGLGIVKSIKYNR